jgi:DNA-directed RNA polymerase subunit M/transcription elongation factor TFIIS
MNDLEQLYGNMLDGELEALAAEAYQLTDVARPLLRAEIARRGLDVELRDTPAPVKKKVVPLAPGEALIAIGKVWDLAEARRAKQILDGIDVTSYFGSESIQEIDEASDNFDEATYPEGIDLKVKEREIEAAVMALRMAPPLKSVDLPEEDFAMKCPKCGSEEVILEGLEGEDADPAAQYKWVCDGCGHEWKDDGVEAVT